MHFMVFRALFWRVDVILEQKIEATARIYATLQPKIGIKRLACVVSRQQMLTGKEFGERFTLPNHVCLGPIHHDLGCA